MNLIKVFLNEGEKDEYYRKIAYRCADAVIKYFSKHPQSPYVGQDDRYHMSAAFRGKKMNPPRDLAEYFERLTFFLVAVKPDEKINGAVYEFVDEKTELITLYIMASSADSYDEPEWKFLTQTTGYDWVKDARLGVMHEFVHLIDAHRVKDTKYLRKSQYDGSKVMAGDPAELKKYYNSNIEYNAYVQQELENLDSELRSNGARSMDDVARLIGVSDANSFVTKFLKMVHEPFRKEMTTDTRKRVAKRANQYWQDLERRFSG